MKILVLGDIHGRECWKDIIYKEDPDLIVFLGDYVSTHFRKLITEEQQINNLKEILEYKQEYSDKVILLRGNHDMEACGYYWAECYPCAGDKVYKWFHSNKDYFLDNTQWIYVYKNICFSHAGVSSVWMENNNIKSLKEINDLPPSEIFAFTGKMSDYIGVSSTQPPTWIRPSTLVDVGYKGVIHVVGHTNIGSLRNYKDEYVKSGQYSQQELDLFVNVWCCDTLPNEYLIIENDKFIVKKYGT